MAKLCEEYKKWVEEKIEEPIKKRKKKTIKKCKKKKCKKWCLCCNKWVCWIKTLFYWIIEWIVKIVGKWVPYVICRIISAVITFLFTLPLALVRIFSWGLCVIFGRAKNIENLSIKNLKLEVIIIDKDKDTKNIVTNEEIDQWISVADQIFQAEAKISVHRKGKIRREISSSLYTVSGSIGEWFKAFILLTGRSSPRHLTIYVVGKVKGTGGGTHMPLYGSVIVSSLDIDNVPITPNTLAHEIGHALLAIWNAYHHKDPKFLMHGLAGDDEWANGHIPKISPSERCAMRQSRWLDFGWKEWAIIILGWVLPLSGASLLTL